MTATVRPPLPDCSLSRLNSSEADLSLIERRVSASCPLLTGHGELMLAEFKYGGVPDETFAKFGFDQAVPNRCARPPSLPSSHDRLTDSREMKTRLFYHLKKDAFPYLYFQYMTQGQWYGKKGLFAPRFEEPSQQ
jgi:hypothetical protein